MPSRLLKVDHGVIGFSGVPIQGAQTVMNREILRIAFQRMGIKTLAPFPIGSRSECPYAQGSHNAECRGTNHASWNILGARGRYLFPTPPLARAQCLENKYTCRPLLAGQPAPCQSPGPYSRRTNTTLPTNTADFVDSSRHRSK